jgi:hypothetical protein
MCKVLGSIPKTAATKKAQHWWLMSIIPATWEAEIGRIKVREQPGQIAPETPSPQVTRAKMDGRGGSSHRVPALHHKTLSSKTPVLFKKTNKQVGAAVTPAKDMQGIA